MLLAGWIGRGEAGDEVAARLDAVDRRLSAALDGNAAVVTRLANLDDADRQARWALSVLGATRPHGEATDDAVQPDAPPDAENTPGAGAEQG